MKKITKLKNLFKLKFIKVFKDKTKFYYTVFKLKHVVTESNDKLFISYHKVIISKHREFISVIFISYVSAVKLSIIKFFIKKKVM